MQITALYIDPNGNLLKLESETLEGGQHKFVFPEKGFIIQFIRDGKRLTTNKVSIMEQYFCSGSTNRIQPTLNDFFNAGRELIIEEEFFFLVSNGPNTTEVDLSDYATIEYVDDKFNGVYFPPFYCTAISRQQASPNSTVDVYIYGLLVVGSETVSIGGGTVNINNTSYGKLNAESYIKVNITTPATYHTNLDIKVDNGTEVILSQKFSISDGLEYVPSLLNLDAQFQLISGESNDLIFDEGKITCLNTLGGQKVVKVNLDIPHDRDFLVQWDVTTNNNGEVYEGDLGIQYKLNSGVNGRGDFLYAIYQQGTLSYLYKELTKIYQYSGNFIGTHFIQGTLNANGLTDIQMTVGSGENYTLLNQNLTDPLNFFITTNNVVTYENIKITLF